MNRNSFLFIIPVLIQLGDKPWCYVLPNTPDQCHALDKSDCNSIPATYCIWDSKNECENNKLYKDEYCKENK